MTSSFRAKSFLVVAALLLLCALPAAAQTATARLEGIVTDNTGAALPGATVTATNTGTNAARVDVTNTKGSYSISALPVGDYRVQVDLSGFKPTTTPITLTVNQVARMDFKMQLGGVSETLVVTAAAPLIDKTTSEISTLIDEKQIENLPLNGRNFTQLATLAPGVNRGIPGSNSSGGGAGTDAETFRYSEFGGAALSVNGLREQFNNYMIEGVDNNESLVNSIAYLPPPEAIREFSVVTTNAPAEFGRAAGAVQNLVIKSGTNQFKGSVYDFYRPKGLAATPKFAAKKPAFNNNDFGATAGGPIFRDKTFFFGSYHGLRNSIPINAGNYVAVPTAKMRNGDFSELLDPATSGLSAPVIIYNPATGQPFAGNIIPPNLISSVGKAYLNAYPLPTRAGVLRNYLTARQKKDTFNDFDARVDQNITQADQLFLSGSHWSDQFKDPGNIPGFQAGFGAGTSDNRGYTVRLGETHVFTESLVNELRLGATSFHFGQTPIGSTADQNKALGVAGPAGLAAARGISLIGGGDGRYIEYLGDFGPYRIGQKTRQISDSVTWLHTNHTFKFGGTLMRRNLSEDRVNYGKGFYFFRDSFGFSQGFSGYEVADMLLNNSGTSFTATGVPGFVAEDINWENSVFGQDDWRVNPNLTLNLGLRYDLFTPYYEKNNRIANFDPTTGRLVIGGQNGVPKSTLNTDKNNFGPRLGFNYLINAMTALRGGYGIFYAVDRGGIGNQLTQNPPYGTTQYRFSGAPSHIRLDQPIPLPDPVSSSSTTLPDSTGVVYIPRDSKTPEVKEWNIGMQREIDRNTSAMVAYVGSKGENLATIITSAGFNGAFSDRLTTVFYTGTSKYNGLQASLRRRESNGLSYLASYTYGNAKNNGPGFFAGNPSRGGRITDTSCVKAGTTNCDLSLDYGRADYDARHRFTVAATYALPFARNNALAGGWNLNTIVTLQTGTPFTVYDNNGKRGDMVGNPNNGPKNANKWFNTDAFKPAAGFQGTEPRNAVTGPPTRTVDLSLFKTFAMSAAGAFELRLEAFNIFNWAQYNQPNNIVGDPNFGKITGTRLNSERQIQLGARYYF
ncbi:MAG: TonB-dependent receptor [Acidobacteriota bacterium]|nr:TonB-dependent receptor [Acidobacteriota bacterium]